MVNDNINIPNKMYSDLRSSVKDPINEYTGSLIYREKDGIENVINNGLYITESGLPTSRTIDAAKKTDVIAKTFSGNFKSLDFLIYTKATLDAGEDSDILYDDSTPNCDYAKVLNSMRTSVNNDYKTLLFSDMDGVSGEHVKVQILKYDDSADDIKYEDFENFDPKNPKVTKSVASEGLLSKISKYAKPLILPTVVAGLAYLGLNEIVQNIGDGGWHTTLEMSNALFSGFLGADILSHDIKRDTKEGCETRNNVREVGKAVLRAVAIATGCAELGDIKFNDNDFMQNIYAKINHGKYLIGAAGGFIPYLKNKLSSK